MNSRNALVALALIVVLAALPLVAVPANATCLTDEEYKHGPRSDELLMNFYADVEAAYAALKAGVIDMVKYPLTYEQYLDACEDPNIQLVKVEALDMHEIDINNNYTIPSYPGVRNPCNDVSFRRAMAYLLDKDYVVSTCCGGLATRIDVPKAAPTAASWINTSVVDQWSGVNYGNYPYEYDPSAAQTLLDDAGFVVGTTPNPHYDPGVPWSQEFLRTYPSDWDELGASPSAGVGKHTHNSDELTCTECAIAEEYASWEASDKPSYLCGGLLEPYEEQTPVGPPFVTWAPTEFDWRDKDGYDWTTSIKTQGCGDCWAFATVGALEVLVRIDAGDPSLAVDLSEQHVVSCGHGSCTAWYLSDTLDYLRDFGTPDEACFPYVGGQPPPPCSDTCPDWESRATKIMDWFWVGGDWGQKTPAEIKAKVLDAPVPTYMRVYDDFYDYTGGIYEHETGEDWAGHFVTIVGWNDTGGYWICKNSWGTGWGEAGWFRIKMGVNECRIEENSAYMIMRMGGQDLHPIIACIRNDDLQKLCMGRLLANNMELSGIPLDIKEASIYAHYGRVKGAMDYHWYTGDHPHLSPHPPLYEYFLYHSDFWYPWGPNYVTGVDKFGNPNYPDIDAALEAEYYCKNITASQTASKIAQRLLVEHCVCIWVYSTNSYWAYRNLLGVVNMDGYGLDNDYTFMNMRTVTGTRPTVGVLTPYSQNVIMSTLHRDRQIMNLYYGAPAGTSMAPYNLARDQPWVIQDWTPDVWTDPEDGKNKTMVTVWFRENVEWVSPVTGAVYDHFTSHDFMFSEWLIAAYTKAYTHDVKTDIHHIKYITDHCVQIFMEKESYWLQYVGDYVVNKALWLDKFCMINTTTVVLDQDYAACEKLWLRPYITGVGPGEGIGQILQMVDCTLDAETLIEDVDYEIVMLEDDHTYFHWLRPASAGQVLTVVYWTIDPGKPYIDGYWPGDYPWQQIAVGIGTHYLVDHVPGAGGYAALKANRNHWLETPVPDPEGADPCNPIPGEVDWFWEWGFPRDTDRPLGGPRCGNYVIDISDVVLCTAHYRSRGNTCPPDPDWFAGADFAPPACYIDIADVVTITGRYRKKFGGWSQCLPCP